MEEWKKRRAEIDAELERVWVQGGEELGPPSYQETVEGGSESGEEGVAASEASELGQGDAGEEDEGVEAGQAQGKGEGLFGSSSTASSSWNPALRPG